MMIVRGESTIIDYHAPFDQGLKTTFLNVADITYGMLRLLKINCEDSNPPYPEENLPFLRIFPAPRFR